MKRLIYFELRKMYKRKSFLGVVLLMMIAVIAVPCSTIGENYWVCADGTEVVGMSAIQEEKAAKRDWKGELTTERLAEVIHIYQTAIRDPKNYIMRDGTTGTDLNNAAFGTYIQPINNLRTLICRAYTPEGETLDYYVIGSLTEGDADEFYDRRMNKVREYLDTDYSYGNYSEEEKQYFMEQNESIHTPFRYGYNSGWQYLLSVSYIALLVLGLVIGIVMAPVFSSEYQTGADAILLSTKYGRNQLIIAKMAASFLLTTGIYGIAMLILTVTTLCIYGTGGFDSSLQILSLLAPTNVNLLTTYLYILFAGYCMCLSIQGITLMLSAKMASPFPVIISVFVLYFVPMFLPYSKSSRLFNHILNLFPSKMAAAYTALSQYELYHIAGIQIPYAGMLILTALVIGGITLPFAYRWFQKHQVK